jgi:hypothetical protein
VVSQCIINYYETAGHKLVDSALWLVISQELPIMLLMYLVRRPPSYKRTVVQDCSSRAYLHVQMIQATTFSFYYLQQATVKGLISIERCEFTHYFLLAFAVLTPILAVCTWKLPPSTPTNFIRCLPFSFLF